MHKKITAIFIVTALFFLGSSRNSFAAISARGTTTTSDITAGSTTTLNKPAGVVQGDFMIAFLCQNSTGITITTVPSGWATVAASQSNGVRCYAYYKVATDSEGASYAWTWSNAASSTNHAVGYLKAFYPGTGATLRIDVSSATNGFSGTNHVLGSLTTTGVNDLLVGLYATNGTGVHTAASATSPFTNNEDPNTDVQANGMAMAIYTGEKATAGSTGTKTAVVTVSAAGVGYHIALKETPTPISHTASNILGTTANVSGFVNPAGYSTTAYFRYGSANVACASLPFTTAGVDIGSGTNQMPVTASLTGLDPGTTYYYCVEATSSQGTVNLTRSSFATMTGCAPSAGGNLTTSSSCAFKQSIDGVDSGSGNTNTAVLTLSSGTTLTLSPAQTLSYGAISKTAASITKFSGAVLKKGPIWVRDPDEDGYLAAQPATSSATTRPAGYVRRSAVNNYGGAPDCHDGSANIYRMQNSSVDADQDGFGISSASNNCVGASSTVGGRTYYADITATPIFVSGSQMLGSSDCLDSGAGAVNVRRLVSVAPDTDQDGYATSAVSSTCVGDATSAYGRSYYKSVTGSFDTVASPISTSDCASTDETRWANANYYVDADGDEYSPNASTTSVCSGSSAPTGYSGVNVAREIKTYTATVAASMYTNPMLNVGGTNYVYAVTPHVSTPTTSRSTIGATGGLSAFSTANQTAPPLDPDLGPDSFIATVEGNSYIYTESNSCNSAGCLIYKAPITNGNVGAWSATSVRGIRDQMVITIGGSTWLYGLMNNGGGGGDYSFYRSNIWSDGSLQPFTIVSAVLPSSSGKADNAYTYGVINGKTYIFIAGGDTCCNTSDVNTVWKAELDPGTGAVGTFVVDAKTIPALANGELTNGSLVFVTDSGQNYLYYFSGIKDGSCTANACNRVYKAVLNGSGVITAAGWVLQTNLRPTNFGSKPLYFPLSGTHHVYLNSGHKSTFGASSATGLDTNDANAAIHP